MRHVRAAGLFVLAVLFVVISWGPLRNLFSDYRDSPTWVYLVYGVPFLALAMLCAVLAWLELRK
jgi:hypothetical protein